MSYNILIVKMSAIGDVIHALPVAAALKHSIPEAKITWVVEKPAADLVMNNPYIDHVVIFEKPKFKSFTGLLQNMPGFISALRKQHFDVALDLQGLFKSAAISYLSGAGKRLVYCNPREFSHLVGEPVNGPNSAGHVVERYLDVARQLGCIIDTPVFGITIPQKTADLAEARARQAGLSLAESYVVLIPGTNWPNKCWPATHFAALADKLYSKGLIPVITGGAAEQYIAQEIIQNMDIPAIDLTGKTSLLELAHILTHASAVVAGDTGPMHLAAAVNTPVVALFGPTDPDRNGPFGTGHKIILTERPCRGCWHRQCPEGKDCLADIGAEAVLQAVEQVRR